MKKFLVKFDRVSAWSLIGVMVVYFISGYGMTKEIIPAPVGKFIHDSILPIPSIIAFAFHSAYGVHIALKRWRVWGRPWSIALVAYVVVLVVGVVILQFVVKTTGSAITGPVTIDL